MKMDLCWAKLSHVEASGPSATQFPAFGNEDIDKDARSQVSLEELSEYDGLWSVPAARCVVAGTGHHIGEVESEG